MATDTITVASNWLDGIRYSIFNALGPMLDQGGSYHALHRGIMRHMQAR